MLSLERHSNRIAIAGASSLLGAELKTLLGESRFAGEELLLLDELPAAGTLTEAGGEPAVILPVEEGSFDRAGCIFFCGLARVHENEFARGAANRRENNRFVRRSSGKRRDGGVVSQTGLAARSRV